VEVVAQTGGRLERRGLGVIIALVRVAEHLEVRVQTELPVVVAAEQLVLPTKD